MCSLHNLPCILRQTRNIIIKEYESILRTVCGSPLNGEQFSVRALYAHMIGRPFLHGHCGRITEKMISRGNGKVMEKKSNHCIACSVHQCANNSGEGYCALEKIQVGTHEQNPTVVQCTDCESFVLGNQNCKDCHF